MVFIISYNKNIVGQAVIIPAIESPTNCVLIILLLCVVLRLLIIQKASTNFMNELPVLGNPIYILKMRRTLLNMMCMHTIHFVSCLGPLC